MQASASASTPPQTRHAYLCACQVRPGAAHLSVRELLRRGAQIRCAGHFLLVARVAAPQVRSLSTQTIDPQYNAPVLRNAVSCVPFLVGHGGSSKCKRATSFCLCYNFFNEATSSFSVLEAVAYTSDTGKQILPLSVLPLD